MAVSMYLWSCLSLFVTCVAAQNCRNGWTFHAGSCYGFGESAVSWGDAQELCLAFNAKLAEIETQGESTFVKVFVANKHGTTTMTWLGGTNIFGESTWEWVSTGQTISTFTDWAAFQPDATGHSEDCLAVFQVQGYKWNDYNCDRSANFLCEATPEGVIVG